MLDFVFTLPAATGTYPAQLSGFWPCSPPYQGAFGHCSSDMAFESGCIDAPEVIPCGSCTASQLGGAWVDIKQTWCDRIQDDPQPFVYRWPLYKQDLYL